MPVHFFTFSRHHVVVRSAATMAATGHPQRPADESKSEPDSWVLLPDTHLLSATSMEWHYAGNKAAMGKRVTVVSEIFNRADRQLAS